MKHLRVVRRSPRRKVSAEVEEEPLWRLTPEERYRIARDRKVAEHSAKRLPDQGDGIIRFRPRRLTPGERQLLADLRYCLVHGLLIEHNIPRPWDRKQHAAHDVHPCWPLDDAGVPLVPVEGPTFEECQRAMLLALRIPGYTGYIMNTCGIPGCMRPDHHRDP